MQYVHRFILIVLFLILLGSIIWIAVEAGEYYLLPNEERPHHFLPDNYYNTPKAERPEKLCLT